MARYRESVCRLCRRKGLKLFLKGERCFGKKCAFKQRSYGPGEHGQQRKKYSEYALQLKEKQKVKIIYGVLEKQFRNYFKKAERQKGLTGESLLRFLESRLDSVVYNLGFAVSRNQARQIVRHRHFMVNKKIVSIPSFLVKKGDLIEAVPQSMQKEFLKNIIKTTQEKEIPGWLIADRKNFKGTVNYLPSREEIKIPVEERLIIELYSK